MVNPNQYGRTMFLFAGVPGMQMPVSYYKDPSVPVASGRRLASVSMSRCIIRASSACIFPSPTKPMTRWLLVAAITTDNAEFYHDVLMTNHMEFAPGDFAEGIRGKVLWHNEYRSKIMYNAEVNNDPPGYTASFPPSHVPGGLYPARRATAPYHNYHCDGCHVRNGSGIPINTWDEEA